jgi:hypothetical protein
VAALLAVLLAGLAAGCTTTPETNTPKPPTPDGIVAQQAAAPAAAAPAAPAPEAAPLPVLVADTPLAPAQQTLRELAFDPVAGLIFVTDTANQLHVVDAATYASVKTFNGLGDRLLADPTNRRLYVYTRFPAADEPGVIHVIDTTTLEEVGTIPGRAIAVDSIHHRLFVGEPYSSYMPSNGTSVRVVDGATLDVVREIPQPGAPVYNPVRDELLIVAYTLYTADPETGAVTGDLFPELTSGELSDFLWCNGCEWVDGAFYDAASGLIAVDLDRHCTGAGCGYDQPATFLDAATLAPQPEALAPLLQAACGATPHVVGEVAGRRYRNDLYARYIVYTNFRVADVAGTPLTWREGFRTTFINPNTNQGYLEDGTVVDLATLAPIGVWPPSCLLAYDPDAGLLYGKRGQNLVVVAEQGGVAPAPAPPSPAALDDALTIQAIRVSPDYPADSTLLVELAGGGLLRSTDGGATFSRLHGGLPEPTDIYPYVFYAFFSPNYAADRTIYVTGHQAETLGAGVWRSHDGGDSFVAQWQDLIYRRGQEIVFSPDYAVDQTLAVRAPFYEIATNQSGGALQLSTDGGQSWTVAATIDDYASPTTAELLAAAGLPWLNDTTPAIRIPGYGQAVVYAIDGGAWQTTTLPMADGSLLGVLPAPDAATTYVYGANGIWRTTDGGATWQGWHDPRLAAMTYENDIDAVAVSPAFPDGTHRLFVGTADAQLWVLDPAQMNWANVVTTAPATPTLPAPLPTVTAAPQSALRLPTPTPVATTQIATTPIATTPIATTPVATTPVATVAVATVAAPASGTPAATTPITPLAGAPPAGFFRPVGSLGVVWEVNAAMQQALGWATQEQPDSSQAADQPFEQGRMIWVEQQDSIYVIYNDGSWERYPDAFEEGMAERDPTISPPGGKLQPERGFGKVWREQAAVRERIGWALAPESPADVQVHPFERGAMLRLGVAAYALVGEEQGTWLR